MHARWIVLTLATGLAGGLLAAPPARAAEDPRDILLHSLEPEDKTYVGEQVTVPLDAPPGPRRRALTQRDQVYRSGNVLRTNFYNGRVVFDDGKVQIRYFPRQGTVERLPSALEPTALQKQRRAILRGRVQVTYLREEEVAGRKTHVVSLRGPGGGERRIWIDQKKYLQLRQDLIQPNGRTISTYFTRIDFDAEPPPAMLVFTPPPGALVVEGARGRPITPAAAQQLAQAWGGLLEPKQLPANFRFRAFYRHQFNGRTVLVSVYDRKGRESISVFQAPTMGMSGMREKNGKRLQVLSSTKGRADVMMVGPLPEEELQKVMDSVAPQ